MRVFMKTVRPLGLERDLIGPIFNIVERRIVCLARTPGCSPVGVRC